MAVANTMTKNAYTVAAEIPTEIIAIPVMKTFDY